VIRPTGCPPSDPTARRAPGSRAPAAERAPARTTRESLLALRSGNALGRMRAGRTRLALLALRSTDVSDERSPCWCMSGASGRSPTASAGPRVAAVDGVVRRDCRVGDPGGCEPARFQGGCSAVISPPATAALSGPALVRRLATEPRLLLGAGCERLVGRAGTPAAGDSRQRRGRRDRRASRSRVEADGSV
jgi:hypothetical protein